MMPRFFLAYLPRRRMAWLEGMMMEQMARLSVKVSKRLPAYADREYAQLLAFLEADFLRDFWEEHPMIMDRRGRLRTREGHYES